MEIKQTQQLTQVLALTPQMKQSLRILQLPLMELRQYLEVQMQENPLLDYEDPAEDMDFLRERIERFIESSEQGQTPGPRVAPSLEDLEKKRSYRETLITQSVSLKEQLSQQVKLLPLDTRKYAIAGFIIGNLDDAGYLNLYPEEIARSLNKDLPPEEKISRKEIEEVLDLIHGLNPPGVGARNLKECLLLQLKRRDQAHSLAAKIVQSFLPDLAKNRIKFIAKKLKVSTEDVVNARRQISTLEPKPGRVFTSSKPQDSEPPSVDAVVRKTSNKYEITINSIDMPRLRVNSFYLDLLKSDTTPEETKKYIQEKIKSAMGLIKAVNQRRQTMEKIVGHIVNIQQAFFDQGDNALLKPLSLKDVAKVVNRNESTISRVVNNKYMETPYGTFRLDYFFTRGLKTESGEDVSQENIKSRILDMVSEENPKKPLKDSHIVAALQDGGIKIARRTVAKYREELKIPPYHQRKKKT